MIHSRTSPRHLFEPNQHVALQCVESSRDGPIGHSREKKLTCQQIAINQSNLHACGQRIWAQVIVGNLPHMYKILQTPRATSGSQCGSFATSADMNEILCEV